MRKLLATILVLNLVDLGFTTWWLKAEVAGEANPLMYNAILVLGIELALAVKMLLVVLGLTILWLYEERSLAKWGAWVTVLAYAGVTVYHVIGGIFYGA